MVQQCIEDLWASRADGRWSALECALIIVLTPKKAIAPAGLLPAQLAERRMRQRRKNVIELKDYLDKRRRADRRKPSL